ncbi:MAG: hypothetical protein U0Y82_03975 [Thermoleophilia bacterium]
MRLRLRGILSAAVTAVLLSLAGTASAAVVGLQDDRLPNSADPAVIAQRLNLLAATNTRMTRVDILWSRVATRRPADPRNPADPAYNWGVYDQVFRGLAARGIGTIVDFASTPSWASATGKTGAAPRPTDAGLFAGAIARRYSGAFRDADGLALPRITRIEVWNEPNIAQYWFPQCRRGPRDQYVPVAARQYAALVAVAAREIRAADPTAVVIAGVAGPAGNLTDAGKHCRTGTESVSVSTMINTLAVNDVRVDAWSQHMYPIGSPDQATFFPSWRTINQLNPLLDKLSPGLPVYVTETGYHTSYNRFHRYFVSEQQQSDWLAQTFDWANRTPRVAATIWFNLQDNPSWTGGLLRSDLTAKPAWARYADIARTSKVPQDWLP